jgi:hypothetical protein
LLAADVADGAIAVPSGADRAAILVGADGSRRHQYAVGPKAGWWMIHHVARPHMRLPPLDPDVADTAPSGSELKAYDLERLITYLRLLDADAEGAHCCEVARVVLHLDPDHDPHRALRAFESHLARTGLVSVASPSPWSHTNNRTLRSNTFSISVSRR